MEKDDIYDELEGLVGTEAAGILVDHYAGSSPYFPQSIVIKQKHLNIRKEFKEGAMYRELAKRYGYTERRIRQIIHGRRFRGSCS